MANQVIERNTLIETMEKIFDLGAAGVSAVPDSARVVSILFIYL